MSSKIYIIIAVFLLRISNEVDASASFAPPIRALNNNGGALSTVSADLNGDGKYEFVSAASRDSSDPHFRIYEWNGTGFTIRNVLSTSTVASRQTRFGGDLSVADIDGDGLKDIIVPESDNGGGAGKMSWFKNPGSLDATWSEIVVSTWSGIGTGNVAEHLADLVVGDLNGDGKQDIVTRDVSHGFWVLIQIAGGTTWQPRKFVPTNPREGLTLWNPDGDGDLDVLINGVWFETPTDPVSGEYIKRTIIGAEAWYPNSVTTATINDCASQVETADFNGDGRLDFVISNAEELLNSPETSSRPQGLRVYLAPVDFLNDAWTEVTLNSNFFSWHSCEIGDMDGDGDLDIISGISLVGADNAAGRITVFLNDGTGTAFTEQTIASGNDNQGTPVYLYNASIGDADGDGDSDLFAPDNWSNGPIRFYQNTMTASAVEPRLSLTRNANAVVVSWASTLSGYILETTLEFSNPTIWTPHSGPFTTNSGNIFVTDNIGSSNRIYRLRIQD